MTSLATHRRFLIGWAALIAIFAVYINLLDGKDMEYHHIWEVWHPYYLGMLYSGFLIVPAVLFNRHVASLYGGFSSAIGRAILLMSIGLCSWSVGSLFWFYANLKGIDVPYPSWPDLGYLGLLPLAATALWILRKVLGLSGREILQLLWLPIIFAVVSIHFDTPWLNGKEYLIGEGAKLDKATVVSSTYIISDIVFMSLGLMLLLKSRAAAGGIFFRPVLAIALGFMALYFGDTVFFMRVFNETYYNGDVADVLYAISMLLPMFGVYFFHEAYVKMHAGIGEPASNEEVAA